MPWSMSWGRRQFETVAIGAEDDMEQRRRDIVDAVGRVDTGAGVIILTDMFGGTPSNLAISVMESRPRRGHRRHEPADADQARQRPQGRQHGDRAATRRRKRAANTSTSPARC